MSATSRRAALASLDGARPVIARLDIGRHPEDVAADIIDAWRSTETALRALLGGSALANQALIHEARQRKMISFEVANRLASFLAARDRVQRTEYRPAAADVAAAREGVGALEKELSSGPATGEVPPAAVAAGPGETVELVDVESTRRGRKRTMIIAAVVGALLLAGAIIAAVLFLGDDAQDAYRSGVRLYTRGSPEAARAKFEEALTEDASLVMAYVYLGRIARERGDLAAARQYLTRAAQLDETNGTAMAELAKVMFVAGNYDLARRFFIRAVQLTPNDRSAQGYLGCTLIRMGRISEGLNFLQRAGQGPWVQCAPAMRPAPAPM